MTMLIEMPGQGLARPTPKGGLAIVNQPLAVIVEALQVAHQCRDRVQRTGENQVPFMPSFRHDAAYVECVKAPYAVMLRDFANARAADRKLFEVVHLQSRCSLPQPLAIKMLSVLFGTMTKKRTDDSDENAELLLMACVDMFDPTSDIVGEASGMWTTVSKHPVVLALAIKSLIATQKWTPSPSELVAKMQQAQQKLIATQYWLSQWVDWMDKADRLLCEFDRAVWDAAYANVGSDVVAAMRDLVQVQYDEAPGEDDDGVFVPPSPRWQALDDLHKAKLAAESLPAAACKAKPAKRTRKPQREG
jgi:hypothetical protein